LLIAFASAIRGKILFLDMRYTFISFLSLSIFLTFVPAAQCRAQGTGIGGSVIRNWQTEGTGFGLRADIPAGSRLHIVPELTWFPSFNIVSEYFGGVSVHYDLISRNSFTGYVAGSGHVNVWANASESPYAKAKTMNISPEVGGGLLFGSGCFRPFLEHMYNPVWREGSTHLGLLWYPQCSSGSGGHGRGKGSGKSIDRCPAYH
jgi:hypothetical protein